MLTGENGVLKKATESKEETEEASITEEIQMMTDDYYIEKFSENDEGIEKYFQKQASKGEISSIKNNGDDTYIITKDGYEAKINNDGKVIEVKEKEDVQVTEVWYKMDGTTLHLSNSDLGEYTKHDETKYVPEWAGNDYNPSSFTKVIFENKIVPRSTSKWFYSFQNLEELINLEYLDTSQVTTMSYMFYECYKLEQIDLSNFNTSNVDNMTGLFCMCKNLTEVNLGNFDTSNVTRMSQMFQSCRNLQEANLNSFNTSKVTTMMGMFVYCDKLKNLDLTSFDTNNVTRTIQMFTDVTCNIYVGDNWTLSETATDYNGKFSKL